MGISAAEQGAEPLELFDEEAISGEIEPSEPPPPLERLGGARADFVAALGRRVQELGALLREIEAEPDAGRARDDLRRRLHALAAGARLLRFQKLATQVTTCEATLGRAAAQKIVVANAES